MARSPLRAADTDHGKIRRAASSEGAPLLRAEGLGVSSAAMARMEREGAIERVITGVYVSAAQPQDPLIEAAALTLLHPAVVTGLLTAAIHYDLVDAFAGGTWLLVPKGTSVPRSRISQIRTVRVVPRFVDPTVDDNGITRLRVHGVDVHITNPDRTVIDLWRFPRLVSAEHALTALGRWAAHPDFDPARFSRVAVRLGVWNKLRPVLQGRALR